jgi:hypothetical protein
MLSTETVRQTAQPNLLPLGFALTLAILATFVALTSERLWLEGVAEPPAVLPIER